MKIEPESRTASTVWYREDLDNCHAGSILLEGKLFGCGCRQGGKSFYCVDFLTGETVKLDKTLGKVGITYAEGMPYCLNLIDQHFNFNAALLKDGIKRFVL